MDSKIVWPFAVKDLTPAAEYFFVKCGQWVDLPAQAGRVFKTKQVLGPVPDLLKPVKI